jgi:hypothetical protein
MTIFDSSFVAVQCQARQPFVRLSEQSGVGVDDAVSYLCRNQAASGQEASEGQL